MRPRASRFPFAGLAVFLAVMGPGVITGVVDDDPTGIAGYSVAGAKFGYTLLWALLLSTVALACTQMMVARLGAVTGKGLADLIRERFGVRVTVFAMATLLVANATTTIAEFAGIAGASEIFGVSRYISVPIAGAAIFFIISFWSYRKVEIILLIGSLVFLSYVITAFVAGPHWGDVARGALVPHVHRRVEYLTVLIGLIGTTITPWAMFYNQATVVDKGIGEREVRLAQADSAVGAVVANIIAVSIIVTTAATLHFSNPNVDSVPEVAEALRPLAGDFAAKLFAIGLFNASLMAMAVLPLSTAYAICEAFGWERTVNAGPREAPVFFGLIAGLLGLGAVAVLAPGVPLLFLLILPNLVGGMLLPVTLILTLKLVNDPRLMGRWVNGTVSNAIGWGTTVALIGLTVIYIPLLVLTTLGVV
jgi:NRAMP (natural resistance-associated macrophage protein)-like metal ion transporter